MKTFDLSLIYLVILLFTKECLGLGKQGISTNSIQQGLDQVIRNVKLRLENIFSNPKPTTKTSRLIKTPIETILPESWLDYDFYLGDVPRDVEIQIEDLNRRWQDENIINSKERESLGSSLKKTRLRKKAPSKRERFDGTHNNATHNVPESKIYFTQIIHRRPDNIVRETFSRRQKNSHQQHHHTTDILDNYSPFIYAELLKENETNFVVVEDLSKNNSSESIVMNEIEIYQDEKVEDVTNEKAESEFVTLEVAIEDSSDEISLKETTNSSDTFLPYIPLSGNGFEEDFEMTVIGDGEEEGAASNTSFEFGDVTAFNGDEPSLTVALKEENWAFPILILSGCFASVVVLYQCSVMFSLVNPLTFSSHTLLLGLTISCLSCMMLTTSPTPIMCAVTRMFVPLSYTIIFSGLLIKISFLIILSKDKCLGTGQQAVSLMLLVITQVAISCYMLVTFSPGIELSPDQEVLTCAATFQERLHGHLYNIVILATSIMLYLRDHSVRARYIEARCAGVTSLLTGLVWLAWVLTCVTMDTAVTDLATSISLLVTVVITFLSMFITPRIIPDNSGFLDCYQDARKMEQFTMISGCCDCLCFSRQRQLRHSLSQGNLLEENIKNIHDLTKAVNNASSSSDESDIKTDDNENNKPYAGYRRTNSFDRFPFMSRPLRSAGRPGQGTGVPTGTGVQSLTNPNVLFCTPQDIRRATLSRY